MEVPAETYKARIAKLQDAMKEFGLRAVVLEPGAAMTYLTGVRWGRRRARRQAGPRFIYN